MKNAIKHTDGKIFITCILEVFQISADIIFDFHFSKTRIFFPSILKVYFMGE